MHFNLLLPQQLNQEFHNQKISEEEYIRRWRSMFENIKDEKRLSTSASAPGQPRLCMAQQAQAQAQAQVKAQQEQVTQQP